MEHCDVGELAEGKMEVAELVLDTDVTVHANSADLLSVAEDVNVVADGLAAGVAQAVVVVGADVSNAVALVVVVGVDGGVLLL